MTYDELLPKSFVLIEKYEII